MSSAASRPADGTDANVELSVIIPAHNSSSVIEDTARQMAHRLAGTRTEIIVVENGSTDDTFAQCQRIAQEWDAQGVTFTLLQSEKGMGNALRAGSLASAGRRVLLTADDLPFGFGDIDQAEALPDAAVVIGSKAHPDSNSDRGALRATLTGGFALLRRAVLGMRTGDPQGTFIIDGELLRSVAPDLEEPGFLFTTELVYLVEKRGIRPVEVPVNLRADHVSHDSRISRSDVVSMGTGLFRLRGRHKLTTAHSTSGANSND
ncbi:MAG: glycosyltransferase [Rhodococcus sp.]|nr:glycosyltransferase [Rhodococcus sp. (in: high G+C Gram-positive bacteria)]